MTERLMPTTAPTAGATERKFVQGLGLLDATMIVAGSMIGSGIFIVSADIARTVAHPLLLIAVWAVAGTMTVFAALSYGELAAAMPTAGGQYVYIREAFSPLFGFLYGWTLFAVIQTGTIAAVAVAVSSGAPGVTLVGVGVARMAVRQLVLACASLACTALSALSLYA